MKKLVIFVLIAFAGWQMGGILSKDALGMALGMVFGIMAAIPAVLIAATAHRTVHNHYYVHQEVNRVLVIDSKQLEVKHE